MITMYALHNYDVYIALRIIEHLPVLQGQCVGESVEDLDARVQQGDSKIEDHHIRI